MKKTLLFLIFTFIIYGINAQKLAWRSDFDPYAGAGNQIGIDSLDNAYILCSHNVVKYNRINGDTLWNQLIYADSIVYANDMIVDSLGNIYIVGYQYNTSGNQDLVTIKYNTNANIIWYDVYNGIANMDDYAAALDVDHQGNVCVVGNVHNDPSNSNNLDVITRKYNNTGSILWTQFFNGLLNDRDIGNDIAVNDNGDVFIVGSTVDYAEIDSVFNQWYFMDREYVNMTKAYLIKYNSSGNYLWIRKSDVQNIGSWWLPMFPGIPINYNDDNALIVKIFGSNIYTANSLFFGWLDYPYPNGYPPPYENNCYGWQWYVEKRYRAYVKKYDINGNLINSTHTVASGNQIGEYKNKIKELKLDTSGNFYIKLYYTNMIGSRQTYHIEKYNASGINIFKKSYTVENIDFDVFDDELYVGTYIQPLIWSEKANNIYKYNDIGSLVWSLDGYNATGIGYYVHYKDIIVEKGKYVYTTGASTLAKICEIYPSVYAGLDETICYGDSIQLNGTTDASFFQWMPSAGISDPFIINPYASPLTTTNYKLYAEYPDGCWYQDWVKVNIIPNIYPQDTSIISCDSIYLGGAYQTTSGVYYDTLTSVLGCDSIIETTLTIDPLYSITDTIFICDGDSVFWQGNYYDSDCVYQVSYTSIAGCDSIHILDLTVNQNYYNSEQFEICTGDSILWEGSYYSTQGTYTANYSSIYSCDSIRELILEVHPNYYYTENSSICVGDSLLWHGTYYDTSGTYLANYNSINGCDSIYELNLYLNVTFYYSENSNICSNDSFLWQGNYYSLPGTYFANYTNIAGCDSIHILDLTVNQNYYNSEQFEICTGDSILWEGSYYSTQGSYIANYSSINSCDSIRELILEVHPNYYYTENSSICMGDSLLWQGNYYDTSGTYFANYNTINGCDSIYELNLYLNDAFYYSENNTICSNDSLLWQGNYYSLPGTYFANYMSIAGCDSIYELNLMSLPLYYFVDTIIICNNDSVLWQGNYYMNQGIYYENYNTIAGCDSIYKLNLILNDIYNLTENHTICGTDSIFWHGNYYSITGIYSVTYNSVGGCDSTFNLNLNVIDATYSTIYNVACESYTSPSGYYTWTSSGTYQDIIMNSNGCDSNITINLTINNSTNSNINQMECYSYTSPSGNYIWSNSGVYYDTIPNTLGCDSIIAIDLTINNSTNSTINVNECESYISPSGLYEWYNSGTYTDTITNTLTCDSIITINLSINNSSSIINDSVCDNSIYTSPSGNYFWSIAGIYNDTINNTMGCDSVITIILTQLSSPTVNLGNDITISANQVVIISGGNNLPNYLWNTGDTIPGIFIDGNIIGQGIHYYWLYTEGNNGCFDIDTIIITVTNNIDIDEIYNENEVLIFPNPTTGLITIENSESGIKNVSVFDIFGRYLQGFENLEGFKYELDLGTKPKGIYIIKVTTNKGVAVGKVVLE